MENEEQKVDVEKTVEINPENVKEHFSEKMFTLSVAIIILLLIYASFLLVTAII